MNIFRWVTWVMLAVAAPVAFAQSALELIQGMGQAFRQHSYRGILTYEYGSSIESLEVSHAVFDGLEYEKLSTLTGKPSTIIRTGHDLACIHAGDQVLRYGKASSAHSEALKNVSLSGKSYEFGLIGDSRVAGRTAYVISVKPLDNLRNGFRLYIDKETGLMIKSMTISPESKILERLQFVSLELDSEIDRAEFNVPDSVAISDVRHGPLQSVLPVSAGIELKPTWLPPGFVLSEAEYEHGVANMILYSDGLATVSILIEPVAQETAALVTDGRARRGSTVAYTRPLQLAGERYVLTVMGEVPLFTAARIARHVSFQKSS